jgi:glucan 1,3-beta-glucosidase
MWLNGFNDNVDGYPKVQCDMIPCPPPYMGKDQPGAPPDPKLGKQGPFGTGESTPKYGMCPIDKAFPNNDEVLSLPISSFLLTRCLDDEKTWLCENSSV